MIMDGNRRFSKRLMKTPWEGHEYGSEKLKTVLEWCEEANVRALTVFAFSLQNLNRPTKEYDYLMKLFQESSEELLEKNDELKEKGIRIRFLGRQHIFPENLQNITTKLEEITKDNESFDLNICFGYGGREEIVDASRKLVEDVKKGKVEPEQIDEGLLDNYMYMSDKPDIIIRTGGEKRISNFLSWQSAYSEWFFVDTLWPEFKKEEFFNIIDDFKQRDRRFGK